MRNLRHAITLRRLSTLVRLGVVATGIVAVFYAIVCLTYVLNVRVSVDANPALWSALEPWIGGSGVDGWAAFRIFLQAMTAMVAVLVLDAAITEMSKGRFFTQGTVARLEIVTFCLFLVESIPWALNFVSDHYARPDSNPMQWAAIALLVILVVIYRQAAKLFWRQEQAI